MKKHILSLLSMTMLTFLLCTGCNGKSGALELKDGALNWEGVRGASGYEVCVGENSVTCDDDSIRLSKLCTLEGDYTITVKTVGEKPKTIGTMEVSVVAQDKPSVGIVSENGKRYFSWKAKEGVHYAYDLHDGYGSHTVEANEDAICKVELDGEKERVFSVIVSERIEDATYYMRNESSYQFQGEVLFDMADMVKYPFYTVAGGTGLDKLTFATTLKKGIYDLNISYYVTDINGGSLSGDGSWGRRIWNVKPEGEQLVFFCENAVERFPESKGTLPKADQNVTYKMESVVIDAYGEATFDLADFMVNEMIVVSDIQYNGKSVMAEGFKKHEGEVIFDVSKMDKYPAVFYGTGIWYNDDASASILKVPVNVKDGVYTFEIAYQLMNKEGKSLTGNGLWGRRITNAENDDSQMVWLCEYPLEGHSEGGELQLPTDVRKITLSGKVTNGVFKMMCLDFKADEIFAIKSIKKIGGSSARFDVSKLANYKYVHRDSAAYDAEQGEKFVIGTTKCERGLYMVEISYRVMDAQGYSLVGDGMWGRRMMSDSEEEIWVCETAPATQHTDAANTIAPPTKVIKKTVQVALNKKGRFTLMMHDFKEGEIVVIEDVKYQGKSILKK